MKSSKITIIKSVRGRITEVSIKDCVYVDDKVYIMHDGDLSLEEYGKELKLLKKRLEKANRAKQHIINNMKGV